jgi:hypothetical protein
MPPSRRFEAQLAALEGLRSQTTDVQIEQLRAALAYKNNYLVAKAADLVRDLHLTVLAPDLIVAYERFFRDAANSDPQCWAKNALSNCLAALEVGNSELFLRGLHFHQMEPVWGGQSDTAITLRATCAFALTGCADLSDQKLLSLLIDALPQNLGDDNVPVRIAIFRAMERIGSSSALLLLRMRAALGGESPEVLGACFSAVLSIEGSSAIDFVAHFLAPDEIGAEAAFAIGAMRSIPAFLKLKEHFGESSDRWYRGILLSAVALTRREEALEFLLDLVREELWYAEGAVRAIVGLRPGFEWMTRLQELISSNPRLLGIFKGAIEDIQ